MDSDQTVSFHKGRAVADLVRHPGILFQKLFYSWLFLFALGLPVLYAQGVPVAGIYDDRDPRITYSGPGWSSNNDPNRYQGTQSFSNHAGDTASFTFAGTQVSYVYAQQWNTGNLQVTIDGAVQNSPSNLYAPTPTEIGEQVVTYSGLSNAIHTIAVQVLGTPAPGSNNTYVVIDAFVVGIAAPIDGIYDDRDPHITYSGPGWSSNNDPTRYQGTQSFSNHAGDTASFTFTGTQVSYVYAQQWNIGNLQVTIDGVVQNSPSNLYAPTDIGEQVITYSGLSNATHTIIVQVVGTPAPGSNNTYVVVDALVVGTAASFDGIYDDRDPHVTYSGPGWSSNNDSNRYQGTQSFSNHAGDTASFTFTGTQIQYVYELQNDMGQAQVSIDGNIVAPLLDEYSSTSVGAPKGRSVASYSGLTNRSHTITVTVLGSADAQASGAYVIVDAFAVGGTSLPSDSATIAGQALTAGYGPVPGATVTLSWGSGSLSTTTDANGKYAFSAYAGGNYTVIPSSANFTFSPSSAIFNNVTGNVVGNFTALAGGSGPYAPEPPTTQTSNTLGFTAGDPAKEYIHMGSQVVAVENTVSNPTHLAIDEPSAGGPAMMGTVVFGGWAVDDNAAIMSVTASLDGGAAQATAYGGSRPDVCTIYPNRPGCPNVGWTWNLDTTGLGNGKHTLTVTAVSASGSQVSSAVAFTVNNQPYTETIPSFGNVSFTASPNPMTAGSNGYGQTTLSYSSYSPNVEIHVGSPDGPMVMASGYSGSVTTGSWVTNGTTFFLQDVSSNRPLTINNTMAILSATVLGTSNASLTATQNPVLQQDGTGYAQLTLNYSAPGVTNTTLTVGANYQVVCGGGTTGSCTTGKWVTNGTMFYLHNTPNGATPSAGNVIASFQATVLDTGTPSFVLTAWPRAVSIGTSWSTLQVQGANGFASPVSLSYSGLPAGGTLSYLANRVTPSAESTFLLSTPITARWSYLVLQGQSGSVQHSDIVEIQNWPPQITSYNVSPYNAHQVMVTVSATDAENDLSYVQVNIAGNDSQGTCAAAVSLGAGPSMLPEATANGACSVAASGPASGTGSSATFTIVFNIDSTRFYGAKAISAFVVEQSGIVTSQPIPGVTIRQNQ